MKDVPHLFADLTTALEDMHAIAVEGQAPDLTPDMQDILVRQARTMLDDVMGIISKLMLALL